MFVEFIYELRKRGVKVGAQEALALSDALALDLHDTTLDGFYDVARALLVHREQDLDAFDTAFASYFEGIEVEALQLSEELLDWLENAAPRRELTEEERALLEKIDLKEARRRLQERLAEQRSRHDRGNKWVGTGGTAPHGRGGTHPSGISVGEGGQPGARGALARAGAHSFRALRGDLNLDVRQIELALRRLRAFIREGVPTELDIETTIDHTAKNAGELEVVFRPERRPAVKVMLLLDVGGSMEPHVDLCERLFTASKSATHWKRLSVYYFHNCVYGHLYPTTKLRDGVPVADVLAECDASWKLIVVGDALMHPSELYQGGSSWSYEEWSEVAGVAWMDHLATHFRKTAWLNPESEKFWRGTAATLGKLFPMFRLTLDGLAEAVGHLTGALPDVHKPVVENLFGVEVTDAHRWLEDEKSPDVRAWMSEQDLAARAVLHALPGRERLVARLKELFYVDAIGAPVRRGARFFYTRRHADREKAVSYWRQGRDGDERVLLDPNQMSREQNVSLGVWVPSWDGDKVAYAINANNSDAATLYVRDVESGVDSAVDVISGGKYAYPSWAPDGSGFYYTRWPSDPAIAAAEQAGHADVRFHKLGDDPANDELIHAATGDPQRFLGVSCSRDGKWLFVSISRGWNRNDVYYRKGGEREWQPLVVGVDAQFGAYAWNDRVYIRTNENAPRFKLCVAEPDALGRENWKELVPEAPDAVLDDWSIVGGHLALTWMKNASSELELRTLEGAPVRQVPLPGIGTSGGLIGLPEDDEAYFQFTSFIVPGQIFRTSIASGAVEKWAEVSLGIDATPFVVEQVWYPSKDGTRISMFVVRRRDMPRDGSTPFHLTGYGGFNVSLTPELYSSRFPWLEAGGGFAVVNLRGGGEYGEAWHRAGMLEHKQNVFDDFVAAAEFLIADGYTRPERLVISGGSNGGLLVGAALTQRPELFAAVMCQVPLLDMLRYHKFGLGTAWIPEYGSADDEAGFRTLYAYSPYHHVRAGVKYPAVLMLSADSDDRVDPMHARKMTAALQAVGAEVLLRIEPQAGHGGADLIKQAVEQLADSCAFAMSRFFVAPQNK